MADPEYFTLAELRALPDMDDADTYTEALCLRAAAYITGIVERECRTSFIARTVVDEAHDGGLYGIVLDSPHVLSVTSATVDGVAVTDTLTARDGILRRYATAAGAPGYWASGSGNVLVTYQAGYSTEPPADLKEAVLQGTRARLLDTASSARVNDRTSSITNDVGGTTSFVLAGPDRPTGYPEVDAVIIGWRNQLAGFGFA